MRLLPYPVSLILFAAISIATPPPGYVKPPNDDKDPPSYQYKYEIGDVDGKDVQGKTETRSGELASGRYYVNGEKSSTDVKYYADEWGYHPLVKYQASNDHSSATTHFALGEHVVSSLLNGSQVGEEVKLPPVKGHHDQLHRQPLHRRRRPVQVVQSYTPVSDEIAASSTVGNVVSSGILEMQSIDDTSNVRTPHDYDNQGTPTRASGVHDATSSIMGFWQNFNNYVTLPRPGSELIEHPERLTGNERDHLRQRDHPELFPGTTAMPDHRSFVPTNIYPSNPSTLSSLSTAEVNSHDEIQLRSQETSNDLSSTISDDILFVQNAGSFGRRLKPAAPSSANENPTEPKTQEKFASSIPQTSHEISTLQPILRISDTTDGLVEHGASSYASYTTSVTTPRPTSAIYSTLIPNDAGHSIATPIPDFQDFHNSFRAEVSSNDYRNTINDVGHRDNAASGAYAGIFAKIYPNGERDHAIGERVNSLLTGSSQLLRYEGEERNGSSIGKNERVTPPGLLAYDKKVDHQLYVTLRQSLDTEIRDLPNVPSSTPAALSTFKSKPIIVAELSSYKADKSIEYSTTFPCNNEEKESSTSIPNISSTFSSSFADDSASVLVTPKLQASHSHITTSSVILNPIQAGVSLVNADETELIASENHGDGSSALVNESIKDESEALAMKKFPFSHSNELEKIVMEETRPKLYETINPAFGQSTFGREAFGISIGATGTASNSASGAALVDGNAEDQQIEIQKSVEIYQNAPVREIHYPPQVITQVSGINHNYEQGAKQQKQNIAGLLHQRDEAKEAGEAHSSYVELQDAENAKQLHNPVQGYNGEEEVKHESHGAQLSLENIRDGSFNRASVYHGNMVRQDNELVDYSIERNNDRLTLLPRQENGARIIKLIRESIPEVKYTAAKTPRINVKVYPTIVQVSENGLLNGRQQEAMEPQEQRERAKTNAGEHTKKVQSQLQRILTESGGVQRHFSGAEWTELQAHEQQHHPTERSQEHDGNYRVHENIDEPRVRQPQQQQSIILPWAQLYDTSGVKNFPGSLGNTVEDIPTTSQALQQAYPGMPTGERIVEKTVHVPQPYPVEVPRIIEKKVPYPVEKIVERKVPYPVEKIIEKKIPVPQPYPVHIQVPVDRIVEKQVQILQPYPVHIEKIIEKKVPYPVQRLVPQPYPVHILQPYPVEKIIEKPVHIPVTIEKIVEKKVHVPQPYPVQVPIKVPYPVEITKYVEQSVHVPYGVRYGVSYQQIMKPQSSKGLYGSQDSVSVPLYGLSLVSNQKHGRERPNETQEFQGYSYDKPAVPFVSGRVEPADGDQKISNGWEQFANGKSSGLDNHQRHQAFAKKSYVGNTSKLPTSLTYPLYNYSGMNRRHASYRQSNGPVGEQSIGKNEYVGPVPSLKQNPQYQVIRSRSSADQQQQLLAKQQHSTAVPGAASPEILPTSSRRARKQDNSPHYQMGPGAFRQSKIEYGFKPPMVPSVQYDEKTATKIDN